MQLPTITTYRGKSADKSFYVLNKGINSGKPMEQPCANCFVVTCTDDNLEYWFWLTWGLWKSKSFHPLLRGSVIEFITVDDYRNTIRDTQRKVNDNPDQLQQALTLMRKADQQQALLEKQIGLLANMKTHLFRRVVIN